MLTYNGEDWIDENVPPIGFMTTEFIWLVYIPTGDAHKYERYKNIERDLQDVIEYV